MMIIMMVISFHLTCVKAHTHTRFNAIAARPRRRAASYDIRDVLLVEVAPRGVRGKSEDIFKFHASN